VPQAWDQRCDFLRLEVELRGLTAPVTARLRALEDEKRRLKTLLA
jgi:hypothetical protein